MGLDVPKVCGYCASVERAPEGKLRTGGFVGCGREPHRYRHPERSCEHWTVAGNIEERKAWLMSLPKPGAH